jgi:hypothetical protein
MAYTILVRVLISYFFFVGFACAGDTFLLQGELGEKRLDEYHERYTPLVFRDLYRGRMSFKDDLFFQNYLDIYMFEKEKEYADFLGPELTAGFLCPNDDLSKNFEDIRYSYRLIALSFLIEAQWHNDQLSKKFGFQKVCQFSPESWAKSCRPQTAEMKEFITNLKKFSPKNQEKFPETYSVYDWIKSFKNNKFEFSSHYRLRGKCTDCNEKKFKAALANDCDRNRELMGLICNEKDEIYGLSSHRDAYFLLGQSNIINSYNEKGQALGCLRRFSEVFAAKEVSYPALRNLFPPLLSHLKKEYGERFLQGRVFFYGAGKEFRNKGLAEIFVEKKEETVVETPPTVTKVTKKEEPKVTMAKAESKPKPAGEPLPEKKKEIPAPIKSAFLQAAEARESANLSRANVDMMKLKYDYVFSLHMINTISERLKTFMTQSALQEMVTFDSLGTKKGPVPLLFIKFMIDMEEHQGLWNLVNVLGNRFYVSNEIDAEFKPAPQYVELENSPETEGQWQLSILRPY